VQRIYQITSGHPYYTQLICHELFSACQKENKRRITRLDVEAILPDVVERGTVNLKFIWDEAADLEKWALACLAQVEGISDIGALSAALERQRVRFSDPDLNSAALHLQEKDVLHPDLGFVVHLLRLWLQASRPLGRVREELQEINPIADRFIEIGDEYKDRGSPQEAIQSYQQALSVDPANLRAQLSIAGIYLAQEDHGQAAGAYSRALEIDPEDVQARSGFCQAHLELGEDALAQADTAAAIDHLRRVVDINPDHSEVRQRLADILCQQAEQMLAQGRDEDALKAIHAAHHYTPDDEALLERYNQVCSQVKGRVLASLLERASTEWKRQNWSQAIACLEEYLEFEPDAGEVRHRLEDLRQQERQSRLSALKAQAQSLEKAERWDDAIAAWQEYLALQPEDRTQAEGALQAAQRYQALAKSYAQAQAALRQKEFGRASALLQGIIAQQPSYKDTARLLAEAIVREQARRPVWKQPWVWAALVFVILAGLSGVFGRDAISFLSARINFNIPVLVAVDPQVARTPPPEATRTGILEAMPTSEATQQLAGSASTPSAAPATPTSEPAWISGFVQPLMDQIEGKSPDFQDDFSQDRIWLNSYGVPVEKTGAVSAGSLRLSTANGETSQALPRLATDFVLEVDFQPDDLAGKEAVFALNLRDGERSGQYRFEIDPQNNTYRLSKPSLMADSVLAEGTLPAATPGSSASLRTLTSGNRLAFLWNDAPLASVSDNLYKGGDNQIVLSVPSGSAAVDIDGVKLWDLNPVELPIWVQTFAQPLLNIIRDRPPDFEDDFSKANPAWMVYKTGGYTGIQDYVIDGAFRLKPQFGQYHHYLQSTSIQAHDFILQFDLGIDPNGDNGRSGFQEKDIFRFTIDPKRQECYSEGKDYPIKKVACSPGSTDKPDRYILISSGDQFGVYLNGEPLINFTDVPEAGLNNQFWFASSGEWKIEYYFDNFKFWNLDSQ
jgi:tetratricopeptide (TPR) repeat protein